MKRWRGALWIVAVVALGAPDALDWTEGALSPSRRDCCSVGEEAPA